MHQININTQIYCSNCNKLFERSELKTHPCLQTAKFYCISKNGIGSLENYPDATKDVFHYDTKIDKLFSVKQRQKNKELNNMTSPQASPMDVIDGPKLATKHSGKQIQHPAVLSNYTNPISESLSTAHINVLNDDKNDNNKNINNNIGNSNSRNLDNSGLVNIGNSCFMNCTIQLLSHIRLFLTWIYDNYHHNLHTVQDIKCCTCALYETLSNLSRSDPTIPIQPKRMFNLINGNFNFPYPLVIFFQYFLYLFHPLSLDVSPTLRIGEQADVHEYLLTLLQRINAEQKKEKQLDDIFSGSFRQSICCIECKNSTESFNAFWDIELSISNVNTIDEALKQYFQPTTVSDYYCDACKTKVVADVEISIDKMPNILILQFKRFNSNLTKISKFIKYFTRIDLQDYASSVAYSENLFPYYRLVGLIVHDGISVKNGHYYLVIKEYNGEYFKFSDTKVEKIAEELVFQLTPYLIIYKRKVDPVFPSLYYLSKYREGVDFKRIIDDNCDTESSKASEQNHQQPILITNDERVSTTDDAINNIAINRLVSRPKKPVNAFDESNIIDLTGNDRLNQQQLPKIKSMKRKAAQLPSITDIRNLTNFVPQLREHNYYNCIDDSDVESDFSSSSSSSTGEIRHRQRMITVAVTTALIILMLDADKNSSRKVKRKCWVRPLFEMRERFGFYYTNFPLIKNDPEMFHKYTRMTLKQFNDLLKLVKPTITKQHVVRKPIPAEERLLITLRYLASGNDHESLSFAYNVSVSAIQRIIPEVCGAIWYHLKPSVLRPCDECDWRKIAEDFAATCHFPHCIGAIDGKHINIKAPAGSGSQYFDYKQRHSVHLLAIADSKYIFRVVDIGALGRQSDGGVFIRSAFYGLMERNKFNFPKDEKVTDEGPLLPYVFVGDSAFSLSHHLLTPYPRKNITYNHKVYNCRHTLARRFSENSFGILSAQWRIFRTTIECQPDNVNKIIQACICLHNYLRFDDLKNNKSTYIDSAGVDLSMIDVNNTESEAENDLLATSPSDSPNLCSRQSNEKIRENFSNYFNNEGRLAWIDKYI